ncbi:hypothetical protein P3S67_005973 [Capsicum chacoense]
MDCVKLVLFCMIYPFLCQLALSSSLPHFCPKHQALALLQFKHMFTINHNASDYCGPRKPRTLSLNKSTDCCSWDRVQCDKTTGQEIELDLACSGLQDKFQLSSLKWLDLSYNDFFGSLISPKFDLRGILPERVFHLSNLEYLDLSSNSLTGPIPSDVRGLQNLQYLFLSSNYLNGTIPSSIFSLPSLFQLDLSNNSFSGKIQEFKFNNTLGFVSVKQNQLQGPIPRSPLEVCCNG